MSQAALTGAGSISAANRPAKCLPRDLCARRHSVPIQHQSAPEDLESAVAGLIEVRGLFWENWKGYRELAWMKDALLPVSGGPRDQSSGWAAALAGSLDTLWIMGLRDEFDEAVEAACRIDFDLPGAWPMGISMRDEDVVGGDGFIPDAGEDSLFEHLPKMHELLRGGEDKYQAMARAFLDTRRKRPEWKPYHPEGFTAAKDMRYIRRPEAIESVFYLYRITGAKAFFKDTAWDMFTAINNGTRTDYANAAVLDVITVTAQLITNPTTPLQSFWLAKTLKYFYLVFSTPDVISLDEDVLNTEAHHFRILG
ncbi:hypothetical protein MANI_025182 [Metarhizium anisopliae]|nr:hypothetical protein MANI_025182 [Metarhizium anisopliae]